MAFRKRRRDSDGDSDEDRLPIAKDVDDDLKSEPAKKAKNIWSDMLLEDQLLEKGSKINLDRSSRHQPNVSRGPESYIMPQDEFQRKQANKGKEKRPHYDKPVVLVTPASDDLFGDAPSALDEEFGVKKSEKKVVTEEEESGWWGKKGANKRYHDKLAQDRPPRPAHQQKKTAQLMSEEFTLETMLAAQFDEGSTLDELGNQVAAAMGEKDPDTVKKIVNAIGRELALKLFNDTKEVEQNGGMKVADGSRRRTPGGVFITLFKMDPSVSRETKNTIFDNMRNADKHRSKQKKKAQNYSRQLEDVKKTMDLVAQAESDLATEELGTSNDVPFNDDVVDMC
ncbi:unnamed protein product [Caenorhabditis nigoni]